jgi:hypothetical protein
MASASREDRVFWGYHHHIMSDWKFRDAECDNNAYVGARRPCKALMGRRVRTCYIRSDVAQSFTTD